MVAATACGGRKEPSPRPRLRALGEAPTVRTSGWPSSLKSATARAEDVGAGLNERGRGEGAVCADRM